MKALDLTGQVFGRLAVVERLEGTSGRATIWQCRCECGTTKKVLGRSLREGSTRSCGCLQRDAVAKSGRSSAALLTGKRVGRLIVIEPTKERRNLKVVWRCLCDCGNEAFIVSTSLVANRTRSCGCWWRSSHKTHGLTGTLGYKNAKEAKRRAEILQRTPEWVDLDAIRKFYMGCPKGHHVDHELPLKGRLVSGLHVLGNLQYLPADENVRKHNKFTPYVTTNNQQ